MRTDVAHSKWRVEPATPWRLPRLGDERLARQAARGDPGAFAAVYGRYHQTLYRYCRSILRDDADAQDALQSTFTRALSALKRGQRSAPLRPWLFRIAHNEAISLLRRRRRGEESLAEASLPVAASAEDQAGERARMAVLLGDLAALPERARSALVMRELSGLSHEDIAIALDTTPGAAKQAIFEARRGLVECVEGRAMACAEVCKAISDGDRRVLRGRRVRAHLRDCASCAAFASAIGARQSELRALVPVLPVATSAAVLARATQTAVSGAGGGGAAVAAGAAGKTVGVAFTSKGFATASVLATAAVSVGGVAAVVRVAPDPGRLFKAPGGSSSHIRSDAHVGSVGHGGSVGHAVSVGHAGSARYAGPVGHAGSVGPAGSVGHGRSVRNAGSTGAGSRVSGSGVGSRGGGTHTGAPGVHARSVHGHGYGLAVGWHQAAHVTHGEPVRAGHGQGGVGLHRGWSVAGPGAGAVPGVRHGTLDGHGAGQGGQGALEGYAAGQGGQGALKSYARGRALSGAIGGNGGGRGRQTNPAASTSTPGGKHHGRW